MLLMLSWTLVFQQRLWLLPGCHHTAKTVLVVVKTTKEHTPQLCYMLVICFFPMVKIHRISFFFLTSLLWYTSFQEGNQWPSGLSAAYVSSLRCQAPLAMCLNPRFTLTMILGLPGHQTAPLMSPSWLRHTWGRTVKQWPPDLTLAHLLTVSRSQLFTLSQSLFTQNIFNKHQSTNCPSRHCLSFFTWHSSRSATSINLTYIYSTLLYSCRHSG